MRFTLNQIKKYLKTNKTGKEIETALTMLGLEIEERIDMAEPLKDFIIGEIVECEDHPDSDHLHVLKVNNGTEIVDVVCGAHNVKVGLKGVFARPGNIIPYDGSKLKKGVIRGKASNGMMCSVRELKLGTDHDGIIELSENIKADAGDEALPILSQIYDIDVIYDAEVTPNRPDYLGIRGIARDLSAGGYGEFIDEDIEDIKGDFENPIKVNNEIPDIANQFDIRYIKDVKNTESPKWLKNNLEIVDMKSISSLVDITNYVLLDKCRPLHVFDADKIKGNLTINFATKGEKFTALDGNTYELEDGDIVIRDDNGIQSLAGIMGGLDSSCTLETKNVLLESAYFDPLTIRKTAKRLGIESDSKYRFERGIDPDCTIWGMNYATKLILDICGGSASSITKTGNNDKTIKDIEFPVSYFKQRIGLDMSSNTMIDILTKLGCKVKDNGETLLITPPSYRGDLTEKHDITEELIRIYGYDKLPSESVKAKEIKPLLNEKEQRVYILPHLMAMRGLTEVYTWSFMKDDKEFDKTNPIKLLNPITNDLNVMRKSIIPNLLDGIHTNLVRSIENSNLFELAPVFYGDKPNEQYLTISGVREGKNKIDDWSRDAKSVDVYDVKNDVFAICKLFNIDRDKLRYETENLPSYLNPYKSAGIFYANKIIGYFGEIHPLTLKKFGIKNTNVVCFEINLDLLPELKTKPTTSKKKLELSDLQPISRDFAFIFDEEIKGQDIIKSVKKASPEISSVYIFDIYKGDKLEANKKSIALNVNIVPIEKTLSDEEIQNISNKIIENVKSLGGELRDK